MGHYFEAQPAVASAPVDVEVRVGDETLSMTTDRGVFSYGRLDRGTALLLRDAPPPPASGDLFDLGCGTGAIALSLAQRSPDARIHAVDVNTRALDLCAANARRNGLHNVQVAHPDEIDPLQGFDLIWSNPPVRIGKTALHNLLATWLTRLRPGGSAVLVMQRNLGADSLHRWLDGSLPGWPTTRLGSSKGYRLLQVVRPPGDCT